MLAPDHPQLGAADYAELLMDIELQYRLAPNPTPVPAYLLDAWRKLADTAPDIAAAAFWDVVAFHAGGEERLTDILDVLLDAGLALAESEGPAPSAVLRVDIRGDMTIEVPKYDDLMYVPQRGFIALREMRGIEHELRASYLEQRRDELDERIAELDRITDLLVRAAGPAAAE